ncbi:MAG TPA: glycosyltransferase family protein [Puia sp.]|nr:glycosyltransferase family protein [Puia sp.]
MKILYAIQGTGNGHLSRAREIIPILQRKGELDLLISGTQADVDLPYPVKYRFKGLCFIFGKKGGVDVMATYRKSNLKRLYAEIKSLPIENYDLILNDFEPVSAWACKRKHKHCVGLSHQAAVIHKKAPRPKKKDLLGKAILNNYAPVSVSYGFHFANYSKDIFTPVIRSEIRNPPAEINPHYTVYLPAYSDKRIIDVLSELSDIKWQVFSKHSKKTYREKNVFVRPIENDLFIESLISCTGILCGAGFETPAEALYLKKKLLVIPMKGQYEQQCNAAALEIMGVPVLKSLKNKHLEKIKSWTQNPQAIPVLYPDITEKIIDMVIRENMIPENRLAVSSDTEIHSVKALKAKSLERILKHSAD